jgi:two-component system cell cycle sensor histidine kinase/response regulator CckA
MNKKKLTVKPASPGQPSPVDGMKMYQKIFELYNGILLIFNGKSGDIITANKSAESFFNLTRQESTQNNIKHLCGLTIEELISKFNLAAQAGKNSIVLAHRLATGAIKYLELHCSQIDLGADKIVLCLAQDVTNREHEEYLLQYRLEFEAVISSISTYFIRPDHTQLDSAIQNALRTVAEFLVADRCYILLFTQDLSKISTVHTWNSAQVKPLTTFENLDSDVSPFASSTLFKGEVLKINSVQTMPDGLQALKIYKLNDYTRSCIIVPMISAGMVIGAIGLDTVQQERIWTEDAESFLCMIGEIITNALQRKQMEMALRESENKYRQFFEEDLTGDYIAAADGQIKFCNPAFAKIFGFTTVKDVLNGQSKIFELLNEPAVRYRDFLSKEKTAIDREFEFPRPTGEMARAIGKISGIFDENGLLVESRGYLFDITERKKLEEQLRGAQRMEAVGRLAGGIAHDFNNILTVINGYCELMLQQQELIQAGGHELEQIKKAGNRAAALIGQLLAFSRKQIVKPKIVNLNTVVKDLESMLRRLIGENIQFETNLAPELGNIKIDPAQLEQVIMNLVVNAKDAMPAGGILTIETSNSLVDENYARRHAPQKAGSYIMLLVKDNGIGMEQELITHIFEPFFTTKEKGKGTGLGLSTLYGIVKQSDGFVWVESSPQQGAAFRIYFPVYDQSAETGEVKPLVNKSLRGLETIFVVEDDNAVRDLTCSFLQNYGYTVYTAESGDKALQMCQGLQTKIDLAIIDVIMPGMSCKELSSAIAKYFPQIKILFISGYTDEAISQQGVLEPDVAFLQKPFSSEALGQKVRQVLDSSGN